MIVAKRLDVKYGSLSALERLSEGQFKYDGEKVLDIKKSLNVPLNRYLGEAENVKLGRVLGIDDFECQDDGSYWLDNGDNISILSIKNKIVKYELGRIYTC